MIEDIKAWGWTIRDLRDGGGSISANGQALEVDPTTPLAAVYIPPVDGESDAFNEARSVFSDKDVRADEVPLDKVEALGEIAAAHFKK